MEKLHTWIAAAGCLLVTFIYGCQSETERHNFVRGPATAAELILFDDFSYPDRDKLVENGWLIRHEAGHPGVPGADWWQQGISFHDDPEQPGNRILRMTSETAGSGDNTRQTQFCHARKYYEGTYAARIRFTDAPESGPDGDQVVQTFYTISPQKAPMHPDYSEMDFEYLPNGGWGSGELSLFTTTWETFQLEPWIQDNASDRVEGSLAGWHTLVLQVAGQKVRYFLDGRLLAEHGEREYPEEPMSINFNLWFIKDGLIGSGELRRYREEVDWVFHQADTVLTPAEVEQAVANLRNTNTAFRDTVPAYVPPLASPCNF